MEFQYEKERIFACDEAGKVIAEITFPVSQGVADINHTFVDGTLRGQGVAGRLTEAAVASIRAQGLRLRTSCSYADKWLSEHPEHWELRAENAGKSKPAAHFVRRHRPGREGVCRFFKGERGPGLFDGPFPRKGAF